ncbi:BAX inhibitor (BI)-1/YccA family protein [Beggiatoa leptomitoformis]|uniref:BAX inhibitor (BI)-1/YccA family protein n=2 Tax=Beggiatoa leptomitoformis TaxID=288004 RepID=A0A2N9YJF5_9GAMM|nr:BAX inhibitor (BI)-1/YccA family protein [Beggiatoa leptomitoformis]AUI70485.1 BAX inhibitor (BI)-1/YccA family protein [Beggiatoa leptomitoformis]
MDSVQPLSTTEANKLIRNTYTLLSMTLLFSAITAGIALAMDMPPLHWVIVLVGYFGLFFTVSALRNSVWGILAVFALTGFMGMTLGPVVGMYMKAFGNGHELVMMAFGSTAVIFLGLSGYALTSRKDFSFLSGFVVTGVLIAFLAGIGALVFNLPGLHLAVSAMFVLLMSGMILWQTSDMVHGYETNYIMATVTLYISIYNLFVSLLNILGIFGDE